LTAAAQRSTIFVASLQEPTPQLVEIRLWIKPGRG
jgi:hypothetical protein